MKSTVHSNSGPQNNFPSSFIWAVHRSEQPRMTLTCMFSSSLPKLGQHSCSFPSAASMSPLSSFNDAGGPASPCAAAEAAEGAATKGAVASASPGPPNKHKSCLLSMLRSDQNNVGKEKMKNKWTRTVSLPKLSKHLKDNGFLQRKFDVPCTGWSNVMTSAPLVLSDA